MPFKTSWFTIGEKRQRGYDERLSESLSEMFVSVTDQDAETGRGIPQSRFQAGYWKRLGVREKHFGWGWFISSAYVTSGKKNSHSMALPSGRITPVGDLPAAATRAAETTGCWTNWNRQIGFSLFEWQSGVSYCIQKARLPFPKEKSFSYRLLCRSWSKLLCRRSILVGILSCGETGKNSWKRRCLPRNLPRKTLVKSPKEGSIRMMTSNSRMSCTGRRMDIIPYRIWGRHRYLTVYSIEKCWEFQTSGFWMFSKLTSVLNAKKILAETCTFPSEE